GIRDFHVTGVQTCALPIWKGVVITPRPGVPARIELAISPTGEVEGTIDGPQGGALAGVELELVDVEGQVAAKTMSEYDGFFLFEIGRASCRERVEERETAQ